MNDATADRQGGADGSALDSAAELITRWGRTSPQFTGLWLDRRHGVVGVGIAAGDDIGTQELLQARVPAGVTVRVRLVTAEWARLRQVQVHVFDFLIDEGLWEPFATSLEIDRHEKHVEVGLLPATPDEIVARIRNPFPTSDVAIDRDGRRAIAV